MSRRRRRLLASLLACAAVPAAILTGCGGGGGSADVGPAADAPANAALYVDATVRPTGSAQSDAKAALSKILSTPDPGAKIVSFIEDQSKADGHPINYQQDIAPWLGEKAGAFFTKLGNTTQQGAVVVETTNPGAAFAFARKASGATATNPAPQTYNGVPYQTDPSSKGPDQTVFGTVGNFLVEGDLAGFQAAVNASKGDSLGDSSDFKDAIGNLPDDRLGTLYTVPRNLIAALGPQQFGASQQQLLEKTAGDSLNQPVAGAVTASADNIQIDAVGGSGVDTPQSSLIGDVPSQAWLAVGLADLGDNIKKSLDQLKSAVPNLDQALSQVQSSTGSSIGQLTSALGDAVLYVQGTTQSTLTGALVVQTKNPELTGRLLGQLQSLLALGSRGGVKQLQLSGGGTGFEIDDPSVAPRPVEIAQQADKLVISYGAGSAEQTLTPAGKLSGSPSFSSAEGQISSLGADFFLDLPSVFALAESTGSKSDPQYVQAKPYLDALRYLVTGSGSKGDQAELKAVLGLK